MEQIAQPLQYQFFLQLKERYMQSPILETHLLSELTTLYSATQMTFIRP